MTGLFSEDVSPYFRRDLRTSFPGRYTIINPGLPAISRSIAAIAGVATAIIKNKKIIDVYNEPFFFFESNTFFIVSPCSCEASFFLLLPSTKT